MAEIERFAPGEDARRVVPGDFILTHRSRLMPKLISAAQKRRYRGPDAAYAHWSHCSYVVDVGGGLVEAEGHGVQRSELSKYKAEEYQLVRLGDSFAAEDRRRAVEYANAQVGAAFGYLVMFSDALWLLFGLRVRLGRRHHQICSELVAHALQRGGQLAGADPDFMLPADLAKRFGARV